MMIHDSQVSNGVMLKTCMKFGLVATLFSVIIGIALNNGGLARQAIGPDADVVVVGAGISGLSAALEAGRGGANVAVIDMFSVFGGIGAMSHGGVCLVGSPVQQSFGVKDNPELAYNDFMKWGEDANPEWARYYINHSVSEIYEWLVSMGVVFEDLWKLPGNSTPRFHNIQGRGLGLIGPIYRECVRNPNIRFIWNTQVKSLIMDDTGILGVRVRQLRTNKEKNYYAPLVILATGGFQNNLDMVRENWPKGTRFPDRFLIGSGINSTGSGLKMAREAGASLSKLDHQWNYVSGLPDPRYPDSNRGLHAFNKRSIWVNRQGRRFTGEFLSPKKNFSALLKQKPPTYWSIFDENSKHDFFVSGSGWDDIKQVQKVIFDNPILVKTASTIEGMAGLAGLPEKALSETVRRYNEMVDKGVDEDFRRFGDGLPYKPCKIDQPPFYAVQQFPITRKSMGGVVIDMSCRVLNRRQQPIPGLYAVGELTGLAGINGKAALEGTFLGQCIITGRIAARSALSELKRIPKRGAASVRAPEASKESFMEAENKDCVECHDLVSLSANPRTGYWHFTRSHRVVQKRKYQCETCHAELAPYTEGNHRVDPLVRIENCAICHAVKK